MSAPAGLVGEQAEVVSPRNASLAGISGVIMDETMSMLRIRSASGDRWVPKEACSWRIAGGAPVDGSRLVGRPQERVRPA
ncbi:Ribonuclease P protein component 1 [Nitrosopumilaceae archaeon]|nr:ribonuclease P protein subunit [Nitrosopumilus sp.]CAI9832809.1 Ribonuclease P protein component 1 [Nitrosopumilaceae archaeon]MDA7944373.1 ribonuclease P protein subunit [Nitrosopumilus sp.]MDA7954125.1 ribonuclease P protein subunit [Nitrosopumilus sp.]MDA7973053.1 ribonuclease P protein subunit [Nitrosopumilus sp.]